MENWFCLFSHACFIRCLMFSYFSSFHLNLFEKTFMYGKQWNALSKMSGQFSMWKFCVIICLLYDILILMYQNVQNKEILEKNKRVVFLSQGVPVLHFLCKLNDFIEKKYRYVFLGNSINKKKINNHLVKWLSSLTKFFVFLFRTTQQTKIWNKSKQTRERIQWLSAWLALIVAIIYIFKKEGIYIFKNSHKIVPNMHA